MKVQIPDQLKAEVPPTQWGKILGATPVVMAVVATLLAGLSSSEMTRAQYVRSLAAQPGVIVSTLAMAARQRNLLWSLMAAASLLAIAFAVYVYLYV